MVEIYFCSHCNQSIPLRDIQSGAAVLRKGRYLCATCKEIAPARPPRAFPWPAALLALLCVAALSLLGLALFVRPPGARTPPAKAVPAPPDWAARVAELPTRAELQALRRRLEARFTAALEGLRGALASLEARAAAPRPAPAPRPVDLSPLRRGLEDLAQRVAAVQEELVALREELEALSRRLARAPAPKAAPPAPAPALASRGEADPWLHALEDPDPRRRFAAVAELTRIRGPAADQALIRSLGDSDFLIRRLAAEEVGLRRLAAAAPALVELLADGEGSVRAAAVQALRRITGQRFGYRSDAPPAERAQAAARWRRYVAKRMKKKKS